MRTGRIFTLATAPCRGSCGEQTARAEATTADAREVPHVEQPWTPAAFHERLSVLEHLADVDIRPESMSKGYIRPASGVGACTWVKLLPRCQDQDLAACGRRGPAQGAHSAVGMLAAVATAPRGGLRPSTLRRRARGCSSAHGGVRFDTEPSSSWACAGHRRAGPRPPPHPRPPLAGQLELKLSVASDNGSDARRHASSTRMRAKSRPRAAVPVSLSAHRTVATIILHAAPAPPRVAQAWTPVGSPLRCLSQNVRLSRPTDGIRSMPN
jgi:hypothetical protein